MVKPERYMHQVATYWAKTGFNDFGGPSFATPKQTKCRWEYVTQMLIDNRGQEFQALSTVAVPEDFPIDFDGYLFEGISSAANPTALSGAYQIRAIHRTPDLRNLRTSVVAVL